MIDQSAINTAIHNWIVSGSVLTAGKVIKVDQNAPRPTKPYCSYRTILSLNEIGSESRTAVDSGGNSEFISDMEFTLSIQVYGDDSLDTISALRDSINDPAIYINLTDGGIVFVEQLLFLDTTSLLETLWEERAQLDLLMRTASVSSNIQLGAIEKVDITENYDKDGVNIIHTRNYLIE